MIKIIRCLLLLLVSVVLPAVALAAPKNGPVNVLYAGSLVRAMETGIGPAFSQATGYPYQGEGKGSVTLAKLMKSRLRTADVFISADPQVNEQLMGPANGNLVQWYAAIFRNEMVIAYNPRSRFAAQLRAIQAGQLPFYQVLAQPGFRLGRTDPRLDPKGYRTLFLFDLAERYYHQPGLRQKLLGAADNPAQVFPEEQLVARLEAGQLDAGVFYLSEVKGIEPFITLPPAINLGDPARDAQYAEARYTSPRGKAYRGSAIVYTLTIPTNARNPSGAVAFTRYLLSPQGRTVLQQFGVPVMRPAVSGNRQAVPAGLKGVLEGAQHQ